MLAQTKAVWKQQTSTTHHLVQGCESQGLKAVLFGNTCTWPTHSERGGSCTNASNIEICLAKRGHAALHHPESRLRRAGIKTLTCTLDSTSHKLSTVFHSLSKRIKETTCKKNKQTTQPWRKDITEWDAIRTLTSASLFIRWTRPCRILTILSTVIQQPSRLSPRLAVSMTDHATLPFIRKLTFLIDSSSSSLVTARRRLLRLRIPVSTSISTLWLLHLFQVLTDLYRYPK
jgi:hypothetical protein